MSGSRRRRTWFLVAISAMALLAVWSYCSMQSQYLNALDAVEELGECRRLVAQIKALESNPERAKSGELQLGELTRKIESAASLEGIDGERLIRIEPEAARRLGESLYKEKPTRVELRGITLRQLSLFLYRLRKENEDLWVKDLRLNAPHGEEVGDRWNAETTISYLIYAPKSGVNP